MFYDAFNACQIFLTSAERSFSKLKLIKNYLRNYISQDKLLNIVFLSIKILNINTNKIIDNFANLKTI